MNILNDICHSTSAIASTASTTVTITPAAPMTESLSPSSSLTLTPISAQNTSKNSLGRVVAEFRNLSLVCESAVWGSVTGASPLLESDLELGVKVAAGVVGHGTSDTRHPPLFV